MGVSTEEIVEELQACWKSIPKHFRSSASVKRTLQCKLYSFWVDKGFTVVADYFPPRISDRPVEIIVLNKSDNRKIDWALCIDELITLHAVKSLSAFEAEKKIIFTTHPLKKKVDESRFFLKAGIEHFHLQEK